ncbi:DoxX family protein [Streptomyces sp. Je 1-369]|uniref:DoxX family protein n=1 Tax=Streptomyces sp. Je 1-369 TaxID=2966192 RepID=UPI002285DE73|nr:DoxX family protein [Streptomyces sp. Je 1-369]WAL96003.1 DoxX family protein [Streptomyces sp. Je 1-369]
MSTSYTVVTLVAAAMVAFSATSVFLRAAWVVKPIADYGIPMAWLPWLGTAKAAGAVGLVAGLFVPVVGVVAGVALVLYFAGAVVTVVRARWYTHVPYPLMYAAPVIGALALGLAA